MRRIVKSKLVKAPGRVGKSRGIQEGGVFSLIPEVFWCHFCLPVNLHVMKSVRLSSGQEKDGSGLARPQSDLDDSAGNE